MLNYVQPSLALMSVHTECQYLH